MVSESEPQPLHPAPCWPHPGAGGSMGAFFPGMTSKYINSQRKGYQHLQLVLSFFFFSHKKTVLMAHWTIHCSDRATLLGWDEPESPHRLELGVIFSLVCWVFLARRTMISGLVPNSIRHPGLEWMLEEPWEAPQAQAVVLNWAEHT